MYENSIQLNISIIIFTRRCPHYIQKLLRVTGHLWERGVLRTRWRGAHVSKRVGYRPTNTTHPSPAIPHLMMGLVPQPHPGHATPCPGEDDGERTEKRRETAGWWGGPPVKVAWFGEPHGKWMIGMGETRGWGEDGTGEGRRVGTLRS